MKINILINNNFFNDYCSYSFIYPIIKSLKRFKDINFRFSFLHLLNKKLFDCDVVIIDSRFNEIEKNKKNILEFINKNKPKNTKLIFADNADNSGQLKKDFLRICNSYWKGQILNDKKYYANSHYGGRLFTDFYNKKFKIIDKNKQQTDIIIEKDLLKKILVSWNMGLCDHGKFSHLKQKFFSIFKSNYILFNSKNFFLPSIERKNDISCRIGIKYDRETVEYQRRKVSKILNEFTKIKKISRFKYIEELKNSKFVVSPFGWGELCPRDFEAFLHGSILIKPEMSLIKTWPRWYNKKTYLPFLWDLSNLRDQIIYALDNYKMLKELATNAQQKYLFFTSNKGSDEIFVKRFLKLLKN